MKILLLFIALPRCGGTLTSLVAIIQSPTIPLSYKEGITCQWTIKVHSTFGLVFSFRLPWGENVGCRSYIVVKSQNNQRSEMREMKICSMSDITGEVDLKSNFVVLEYHAKVRFMLCYYLQSL